MKKKKNFDYFGAFAEYAGYSCEAALKLEKVLKNYKYEDLQKNMDEIHTIEHAADKKMHELTEQVSKEFITPIEREDIIALIQELDSVTDAIDDVMRRAYMYDVHEISQNGIKFAELIVQCTAAMKKMMESFADFKKLKNDVTTHVIEVNDIESVGDNLHAEAIRELYLNPPANHIEILVWTNMYDALEGCLDVCEEVSKIVESVVMKNI